MAQDVRSHILDPFAMVAQWLKRLNGSISHSQRIKKIVEISRIPFPDIFPSESLKNVRNSLIHEGLFYEKAVGYEAHNNNLNAFEAWINQLIFFLLETNAKGAFHALDRQTVSVSIPPISP